MVHHDSTSDQPPAPGAERPGAWDGARKVLIAVLGGLVIFIGIVLIPLPGPGWLIIFGGLAILGTEFPAARRVQERLRNRVKKLLRKGN